MASNISGAGLNGIYSRLNSVEQYHPFETETFADWATEAGDIIKVKRGEKEYDSPVHTSRLVWKGAPQISLSSTGNKERESVAKVSKKKYRGGSGGLRNEEHIYKEFTSSDGMLWSSIFMSESKLETIFANGISSISSRITQTAEEINASVWGEESSIYSALKMTATNIMTSVGDDIEDIHTEILQTKSMIRNSVWTANSTVFTYIEQTASYILDHVGERSGSKVIPSMTEPQDTQENPLSTGDIWVEGSLINTWDDFQEGTPWVDYDPTAYQYDWLELSGQKVHVWKDGKWNLVEDGTKLVEDTWFLRTKDTIGMIAGNVEKIDGEFRKNLAELTVKADRISSTVTQHGKSIRELGSNITQTATQIRSEVHAVNSTLYSAIEQTATNIRMEVANTVSGLRSVIEQTAGQIRTEVSNTVSGLNSTITQNSDKISLVVRSTSSGYTVDSASIIAGINDQEGSYVKIKAKTIDLSGYVTATELNAQKARIDNLISGASLFTKLVATKASLGDSHSTNVSIYGQTVRIYQVEDTNGTRRNVFGYS